MMKIAVAFVAVCVALSTAASVGGTITVQQAIQEIQGQHHVAIPNYQHTGVVGYYVLAPYDVLAGLSSYSNGEAQQFFTQLQQYGYLPILNNAGRLLGLYTQTTGSPSQISQEATYYVQNLYRYGLTPIVNQQNQVVGLHYSYTTYGHGLSQLAGISGGQYPSYYQWYNYQQQSPSYGYGNAGINGQWYPQYYYSSSQLQHQYPGYGYGHGGISGGLYPQYYNNPQQAY